MKIKFITAPVAVLTLLGSTVQANLGETKAQSVKHYGRIISVGEKGVSLWNVKGYWLTEWFNADGYAELIAYYKKNGTISDTECDAFIKVNLPRAVLDAVQNGGWIEQDVTGNNATTQSRIWFSLDGFWRFERGMIKLGKYFYSCITIGTVRGVIQMNSSSPQPQQPQPPTQPATTPMIRYLYNKIE